MSIFSKKKTEYPKFPLKGSEGSVLVLRCSICTGEQVLCAKDPATGKLTELMLVRNPADLEGFCRQNGLKSEDIEKVY